tara:strand:- start:17 stop:9478 length:9462 start_codon:yes stop_codon:yes gene_type:complete
MAEFQPKWDEKTLRNIISAYKQNPKRYPESIKQSIQQHAEYHNVPFYGGEFSVADALTDLGAGFLEGFTTLKFGEESDNEYEAIFKNLGHLAGFAPGIISAPLGAAQKLTKSASLLKAANMARSLNDKSVPMFAAKKATEFAKKNVKPFLESGQKAKYSAVKTASDFMLGNRARHITEGAFHLGVASGISAWQGGIDVMMSSFVQGGLAGGIFRSIGNFVNVGDEAGNKIAKTLAGSLFQGLPSTLQGATTPEQVYNYVLGAWFGSQERPWTVAKAGKYVKEYREDMMKEGNEVMRALYEPELHPKWEKLPSEVKPVVKEMFDASFSVKEKNLAALQYFAEKGDIKLRDIDPELAGSYQEVITPEGPKIRLKPGSLGTYENFIITSGQRGLESMMAQEGAKRSDRIANIHMVTGPESRKITQRETPGIHHKLTEVELSEANEAVTKANMRLKRNISKMSAAELDKIRKNYFVVKNSDALYLSGKLSRFEIKKQKRTVTSTNKLEGAPGWAAQMAINMKKPVYVYETVKNRWMKYHPSAKKFGPVKEPPKPPRKLGIIEGREWNKQAGKAYTSPKAREAFMDLFEKHYPTKITPKEAKETKEVEVDDKDVGSTNDMDTGTPPTNDVGVGKRALRIVKNYMKPTYKDIDIKEMREGEMLNIATELEAMLPKYLNRGRVGNKSDKLLKDIQEKWNFQLKGEELATARGELRQWVSRRNNEKPIIQLTSPDGVGIAQLDPKNPVTRAGTRKMTREPDKIIDKLWKNLTGKDERGFAILDHVVLKDKKTGFHKDYELSQLKHQYGFGEKGYNKLITNAMKFLAKKENGGYYYFGGKGTDDRLYFAKFHPQTDKSNLSQIRLNTGIKFSDYIALKNQFKERFKMSGDYFDKALKSNVLWTLEMNGLKYNSENLKKITGDGFIQNAKNWNKRNQIWFTDSFEAEKEFYKTYKDPETKEGLGLTENGDFKYQLIRDLSKGDLKLDHRLVKLLSSQNPEHVDGAIIVRDDVIDAMNLDAGTPKSGQNKSFIISPDGQHGALLGKYMFHAAGEKQSAEMRANNNHMWIYESAAKQTGTREFYTDYSLDPSHIKFNYGVKQGPDMLKPQTIKKQILSNLVETLASTPKTAAGVRMKEVVQDIFESIIEPRYKGTKEANEALEAYHEKLPTASDKELIRELDKLDLESVGLPKLIDAINRPGNQLLVKKAYDMLIAKRKKNLMEEVEEAKLDGELLKNEVAELEEFNALSDRMIIEARKAANERGIPESQVSIFTHHFINDYRMKVLSSYIVNQATKPKINNSGSARIRPYDDGLRKDLDGKNKRLKELDKNDELFFLDEAYRDMIIKTDIKGLESIKLGELFKIYQDTNTPKSTKEQLKEVFRSAVMRVPMDSISGTQILEFAGFTGRKGHGILMHSRAMKALGGADLDGDSAYFYMGGQGGFKKNWKDVFYANKKEFYQIEKAKYKAELAPRKRDMKEFDELNEKVRLISNELFKMTAKLKGMKGPLAGKVSPQKVLDLEKEIQSKRTKKQSYEKRIKELKEKGKIRKVRIPGTGEEVITENKDPEIIKDLVKQYTESEKKLMESSAGLFAPNTRMQMAEAAIDGRNLLGGAAVSPKQIMASAYEMVANQGQDKFTISIPKWNKKTKKYDYTNYDIEIKAKTKASEKDYIRKLTRAMVGLSSDPMDYAGLESYQTWWRQMYNAHFAITSMSKNGKKVKDINKEFNKISPRHFKRNGFYGMLEQANSAYYGKDYTNKRNWTMEERHQMTEPLVLLEEGQITTMTPKIARMLQGLDYSDNALRRLDADKVDALYKTYKESLKDYDVLKKLLGRSSFAMPYSKYIGKSLKYKLTDSVELDNVAMDNAKFNDVIYGTDYQKRPEKLKLFNLKNPHWYSERIKALREIRDLGGIFVMKDLNMLTTVKNVSRIIKQMETEGTDYVKKNLPDIVERIHKSVERLKRDSYLMAKMRKKYDIDAMKTGEVGEVEMAMKDLADAIDLFKGVRKKGVTSEMDQAQIDAEITSLKKNSFKSPLEKELFDYLMLGSLNRTDLKKIDDFVAKMGKMDNLTFQALRGLRRDAAKTSVSRLGYNSNALEKNSLKNFLGEMGESYNEVSVHRAAKEIRAEGEKLVSEPKKQENVEKGFSEDAYKDLENFLTETTGWEGVKEAKRVELDPETKSYVNDVLTHLKTENNSVAKNFHYLVRDLLGKDINLMNKADWNFMKTYFDEVKTGNLWQRLKNQKITTLSKRHYMQFPETISRELMKDEIILMQKQGVFLTADGVMKAGKVTKPTQYLDILQGWIGQTNEAAIGLGDKLTAELGKELLFLDALPVSKELHDVAIALREQPLIHKINNRKDKSSALNWADTQSYRDLLKNTLDATQYEKLIKDKLYTVTIDGQRQRLRGEDLVLKINEKYTDFFKKMHEIVTGNVERNEKGKPIGIIPKALSEGIEGFSSGQKGERGYIKGYYDKENYHPIIDIPKFIRDLKASWVNGKPIPMEFGLDGMRKVANSMMLEMGKGKLSKEDMNSIFAQGTGQTGRINFENYWPHMHFNKQASLEALKKYTKHLRSSDLPDSEVKKILKKVVYRAHALTGDWNFDDIEDWKRFDEAITEIAAKRGKREKQIDWVKAVRKSGSQFSRDAHLPGWSLGRDVPTTYAKSIVNTYFRQMAQIFSRDTIGDFKKSLFKRKVDIEQQNAWENFMKLYVQGAMGNPDVVPEHILNNPTMKMRGTPYAWWADNQVKDRINKIGETLGIVKTDMPKELRGAQLMDIKNWSNLEAKFELASLLAHPKSVVNNIFGGTMHTIQSVGFNTWKTARNNKLMAAIFPEFGSAQGRDNFAVKHGIFPDFLMSEYGLSKEYQSVKNKEFIKDVSRKLTRNPEMTSESVRDLAKQHDITGPITEFAAKFMSVPERALRRDAFMAHYLHWYKKLGGAIKDKDHPILIELAKKGVKATQFLYSAPYRPMFARTALGKVMTRFQLWGWNAIRFRKEAMRQAALYGFKGEAQKKAARIMQMDLMVFALGNAFAYSLFEVAMPSPWNWMQDTADWIFGDENERNRAFYGQWPRALAPLQTVTPPILRMPMASMRAILEDDWSRVSDYYIYTMFPFGRIVRDFHGPNNLIENPMNLVDKWTGIPLIEMGKASKERRKERKEGIERRVPTPGMGLY